jgi:aryl-alcohol dehydrogenase-like predicted oxidoreductase
VGDQYYHDILAKIDVLAAKYGTNLANIATKFVLQTPGVSAAILGPRNTRHLSELDELDDFALTSEEHTSLQRTMQQLGIKDDIYSYERDATGPHGRIMKYNLNNMRPEKAS